MDEPERKRQGPIGLIAAFARSYPDELWAIAFMVVLGAVIMALIVIALRG